MTDDLVKRTDAFRLGSSPTDEQVDRANFLIDCMSSCIEALDAENKLLSECATIVHFQGVRYAHENMADDIWAEFKDRWEGEKKFALREVLKYLRGKSDVDTAVDTDESGSG